MPTGIYKSDPIRKSKYYDDNCPCCRLRREFMRSKSAKHYAKVKRSKDISDEELEQKLIDYFEREKNDVSRF